MTEPSDHATSVTRQRLAGRVALVTGASRGLGRAIAIALAAEGARVAVAARTVEVWNDRLPGTIGETVDEIERHGGAAAAFRCDLADGEQIEALVLEVTDHFGAVDVLVNNAAVTVPGRPPAPGSTAVRRPPASPGRGTATTGFLDFPLKGYRLHYEVNVFASYLLMQRLLPGMIDKGSGAVVNISSDAAFRPGAGPYQRPAGTTAFAYGGAKAALQHLTQAVAFEMAPYGVAVNALLPSLPIATPGLVYQSPTLGDQVSEESFAEAVVRLAQAKPSDITGQILYSEDVLHPELRPRGWLGA